MVALLSRPNAYDARLQASDEPQPTEACIRSRVRWHNLHRMPRLPKPSVSADRSGQIPTRTVCHCSMWTSFPSYAW
jgi:hypothetical protein